MRTSRVNDWLQLLASMGVLAGLSLVAYELHQDNVLARAEAVRAVDAGWETISISEYESDIGEIRAKSLAEPENLTLAEIFKLNGYLIAMQTQYDRLLEMDDAGLWIDSGDLVDDPAYQIADAFNIYLDNRFGRIWYIENRSWMDPVIVEIWDREMQRSANEKSSDLTERIMEKLQ